MAYDNTNSGALFRNEDKAKEGANPNWPDYKGEINIEGRDFWLSAWVKEGKPGSKMAGKRFFSLSVKPKERSGASDAPRAASRPAAKPAIHENQDEDVPF